MGSELHSCPSSIHFLKHHFSFIGRFIYVNIYVYIYIFMWILYIYMYTHTHTHTHTHIYIYIYIYIFFYPFKKYYSSYTIYSLLHLDFFTYIYTGHVSISLHREVTFFFTSIWHFPEKYFYISINHLLIEDWIFSKLSVFTMSKWKNFHVSFRAHVSL